MRLAIIDSGLVVSVGEHQDLFPNTSFPVSGPNPEFLVENNCLEVVPPSFDQDTQKLDPCQPFVDGGVVRECVAVAMTPEQIVANYTTALEHHYDATAQSHRYDTRFTCALRAGYPGPFQAEGQAFAIWMDNCNATGYQIMSDVEAGRRPLPSIPELIAELPVLVWPQS